jgi:hypothetical protein
LTCRLSSAAIFGRKIGSVRAQMPRGICHALRANAKPGTKHRAIAW